MAMLLCSTSVDRKIPENYILPPEKRPVLVAQKATIPIIDLHNVTNVMEAFLLGHGLFQVINHGVEEKLMKDAMDVTEEFFDLSDDEKTQAISGQGDDSDNVCKLYTSSLNYDNEETHYWRNVLRHSCNPLPECIKYWPQKPAKYRRIIGAYSSALKDLASKILEHVSEGLGLEPEYFLGPLSEDANLTFNQYPPCPNPSLTLGLPKHTDPSLITILQQGNVLGLQFFKDGQWFDIHPLPNSFIVMVGNQLEIVSNGKLKSAVHRAVTNSDKARTSVAFFANPTKECNVEPAQKLTQEQDSPPLCMAFRYKDFFHFYIGTHNGDQLSRLQHFNANY